MQPALEVSPEAAVEMQTASERDVYDLDVFVTVTRTSDAEVGASGPADGEAHFAGARSGQGSVCRTTPPSDCVIRVKTAGDVPKTDQWSAVPKNWSVAEQLPGLLPMRRVSPPFLWVSSLRRHQSFFAAVCLALSRGFTEKHFMSVQAGERVRTARLMSQPQAPGQLPECEAGAPVWLIHVVDDVWGMCFSFRGLTEQRVAESDVGFPVSVHDRRHISFRRKTL